MVKEQRCDMGSLECMLNISNIDHSNFIGKRGTKEDGTTEIREKSSYFTWPCRKIRPLWLMANCFRKNARVSIL